MDEKAAVSESDYARWQYDALRREIEHAQSEVFKILAGAVTVLPLAQYLLKQEASQFAGLELAAPFITIVIALQFVSHQARILRCGQFIREEIEKPSGIKHGWETWLEAPSKGFFVRRVRGVHRVLDLGVAVAFTLLFAVYYASSLVLANQSLQGWGQPATTVAMFTLIVLGVAVLLVLILFSWSTYFKRFACDVSSVVGSDDRKTGDQETVSVSIGR